MSCQQFELYAAEGTVPQGRTLEPHALQNYVDKLRDHPWWERNFPMVHRIEVHVRPPNFKGGSVGSWHENEGAGMIEMAPCHLNELIVLHEVSHVLAAARYGSRAHDPWFARTYLEAATAYLPDIYPVLYHAFNQAGIDFEHQGSVPGGIVVG